MAITDNNTPDRMKHTTAMYDLARSELELMLFAREDASMSIIHPYSNIIS